MMQEQELRKENELFQKKRKRKGGKILSRVRVLERFEARGRLESNGGEWAGPLDRADKNASRCERGAPPAVRLLISMCHLAIPSPWMGAT
jgi:hypothetical protein